MLHTRPDFVLRAHEVGRGLDDRQRIALGMALISTVLNPRFGPEVAFAGSRISEHGEALWDALLDLECDSGAPVSALAPALAPATTHEQAGRSALPGGVSSPPSRDTTPRDGHPLGWRAAWDGFSRAWRRLEDSLLGDVIGLAAIVGLTAGAAVFLPLIFG